MTTPRNIGAQDYLRPFGFVDGPLASTLVQNGLALPLAGGGVAFMGAVGLSRTEAPVYVTPHELTGELTGLAAERLVAPRTAWPLRNGRSLGFDKPVIMGILNATPDSFSDGGKFTKLDDAVAHGEAMIAAGADILDIGGESTRPGAAPVAIEEEQRRILPLIEALADKGVAISVDTRNAATMRAAARAGASVINDVSALAHDPQSLDVIREYQLPVVLMHSLGDPLVMQDNPRYDNVLLDVYDSLAARIERVEQKTGLPRHLIAIDPGIGFGKTLDHNLDLLGNLGLFQGLGCPLLLGVSRKSFVAKVLPGTPVSQRLPGSLVSVIRGVVGGAQIFRVHDVAETAQALTIWRATAGVP